MAAKPLRIVFAASPEIAVPCLTEVAQRATVGAGVRAGLKPALTPAPTPAPAIIPVAVLTNPDSPKGRSKEPEPTDIGRAAMELGLPLLKPAKLDAEARSAIAAFQPDLLVSFAYGKIFGPKFLGLFPLGGINIHPSLLPKYRGPTPINAAILRREGETGLSIQTLAAEMDAGDILAQKAIPLSTSETAETLSKTIAELAPSMLIPLLQEIAANGITALPKTKQNEADATYCKLLTKDDGRIDWNKSALDIDAQIRAYKPWPPCYTLHGDKLLYVLEGMVGETGVVGTRLAVSLQPGASGAPPGTEVPGTILAADKSLGGIAIQTGDGVYIATKLQYAGKKALGWKDFLNGARDLTGYIFSAML